MRLIRKRWGKGFHFLRRVSGRNGSRILSGFGGLRGRFGPSLAGPSRWQQGEESLFKIASDWHGKTHAASLRLDHTSPRAPRPRANPDTPPARCSARRRPIPPGCNPLWERADYAAIGLPGGAGDGYSTAFLRLRKNRPSLCGSTYSPQRFRIVSPWSRDLDAGIALSVT
jgi:hypothetical protein